MLAAQPSRSTLLAFDSAHHAVAEGKIEFGKLAQEMLRSFTLGQGIAGVDAGFAPEMHDSTLFLPVGDVAQIMARKLHL